MENRIVKIQKTLKKEDEEGEAIWNDIGEDILGFILGKLVYAADVVRARAVCKNWYIPKDAIIHEEHRNLPWLCNFSWAQNGLECETYNSYSRLIFSTLIPVENPMPDSKVFGYGSKQGWLIAGYFDTDLAEWSFFLYNPNSSNSKGFVSLPRGFSSTPLIVKPCYATFLGDPNSGDFRLIVFFRDELDGFNCIHRHRVELDEDMVLRGYNIMSLIHSVRGERACRGMQCINEQLFCLFDDGVMARYRVNDHIWTSFDDKLDTNGVLWLAKGDGDLLVAVRKDYEGTNFSTFCFDWENKRWVKNGLPENSAVLISGDIATFVRPFDYRQNDKDCNVYLFSELVCEKESKGYDLLPISWGHY